LIIFVNLIFDFIESYQIEDIISSAAFN